MPRDHMHPRNRHPYDDEEQERDLNELREPEPPRDESATEFEEFVDGDPIVEEPDEDWDAERWLQSD